jgi:ParB-like chromosome segregation protein Spo0J
MTLRRIEPIPFPDMVTPDLGERPSLEWVSPADLYVDDTYQRDLRRRSMVLIQKMMKEFAWNRVKPPIVVRNGDKLHVVDGQHTAIVAATLGIDAIPVFIVRAEAVDERARAFVGHNTDRVPVAPLDIYRALVAAGDPEALDVAAATQRAGVRLRQINQTSIVAEGDCAAVGTIRQIVSKHGPMRARQILEVLVKAKRAPITAPEIKAVEFVVVSAPEIDLESLARIIRIDSDAGLMAAQSHSKVARLPVWKALVERWRRSLKNVRSVA